MRHLSTEELLLQFDGELSSQRLVHLQKCVFCKAALADLEELFAEVERELRATADSESTEQRLASWQALERALYPPSRVAAFPLRWPAVYATAAALTIAVLAGYLSSWQPPKPSSETEAANQASTSPPAATPPAVAAETPFVASAIFPSALPIAAKEPGQPVAAYADEDDAIGKTEFPSVPTPERFRFDEPVAPRASPEAGAAVAAVIPQPSVSLQPATRLDLVDIGETPSFSAPPPFRSPMAPSTPQSVAALIEGHWILVQAGVWTEDIQPLWTEDGIEFRGTVENASARRRVTEAIARTAGPARYSAELQIRPDTAPEPAREAAPVLVAANGPPGGGVVRNSLLAHFSDAARRSFQPPQPTILEAEIDRYVTDIFRGQARLRAHAYALRSLMRSLSPEQVAQLEPTVLKKFNQLARLHMKALGEDEAFIYDRLSEGLPRRFWTYRASSRDLTAAADWREESSALLRDVLQLDSTLTALLSTPQSLVDISDSHLSCGELLYRIRSRVRSIRAAADLSR